jgi:hypothetical protein
VKNWFQKPLLSNASWLGPLPRGKKGKGKKGKDKKGKKGKKDPTAVGLCTLNQVDP